MPVTVEEMDDGRNHIAEVQADKIQTVQTRRFVSLSTRAYHSTGIFR